MNKKTSVSGTPILLNLDLGRTKRPDQQCNDFYWSGDILVYMGYRRFDMAKAISRLSPSLKASLKKHIISFTIQGDYAPSSYVNIFSALLSAMNARNVDVFDAGWITKALNVKSFRSNKRGVLRFFLHWQERDSAAISQDTLRLLHDIAVHRAGARNVLSDDPEKSWLTDEEYEGLLGSVWDNYDRGASGTQVTLIKLLSMQYARRPIQIAYLKIGDVRESDGSDSRGLIGRIISFPGVKDITAESDFRDSDFEPHPLADHLWDLFQVQIHKVRELYEHALGFELNDDQLKKLPLFCSKARIEEARQLIEKNLMLNLCENLDNKLFHLRKCRVGMIIKWQLNIQDYRHGAENPQRLLLPKLPISPRTGKEMVVSATRMRHTRARQLARRGVDRHMLSHWLGHTSARSLDAYYNDPAEEARQLDEAMAPALAPIAMAFAGALIDSENQATRAGDPNSKLEFAHSGELKSVGRCGRHSFCATTSVPIPCYRCRHFEPLVDAPHREVLEALLHRQAAEEQALKIGGMRNLLIPIDLSADIRAVKNCIARCNDRKSTREVNP